ncbi:MAG: AAA family ATPase [Candidatus Asgardarchaeia archaeon]
MIKLKSIKLTNYCGYKDFELDLSDGEGVKRWAIFYGPNGVGKSNLIRAVDLLSSPRRLIGRLDNKLFLRRLTYHPNYNPTYVAFDKKKTNLFMEAVFLTEEGEKKVIVENNWDDKMGLTTNELPRELLSASSYIDSDNPINMYGFQIAQKWEAEFIDIAKTVYNFDCYLPHQSIVQEQSNYYLYTDFVIMKHGNTQVHYKSFSEGEKKIATLLVSLFRRADESDILLIDNIEMHIYFKRHMNLLNKIEEIFPNIQIIATTHSPIIVNELDDKYLFDLEQHIR